MAEINFPFAVRAVRPGPAGRRPPRRSGRLERASDGGGAGRANQLRVMDFSFLIKLGLNL
jgi:hypothetical protein